MIGILRHQIRSRLWVHFVWYVLPVSQDTYCFTRRAEQWKIMTWLNMHGINIGMSEVRSLNRCGGGLNSQWKFTKSKQPYFSTDKEENYFTFSLKIQGTFCVFKPPNGRFHVNRSRSKNWNLKNIQWLGIWYIKPAWTKWVKRICNGPLQHLGLSHS